MRVRIEPDFIIFVAGWRTSTALARRAPGVCAGRGCLLRVSDRDHTFPRVVQIGTTAVRSVPPPPQQGRDVVGMDGRPDDLPILVTSCSVVVPWG